MKQVLLIVGALFLISAALFYSAITQAGWPVSIVYAPPEPVHAGAAPVGVTAYVYEYEWVYVYVYPDGTETAQAQATVFPLDLNRATREELMLVPGIGEVMSGRIVQYREVLGGFTTLTQLTEIHGISYNTLERISGYFTIGDRRYHPPPQPRPPQAAASPGETRQYEPQVVFPLDLNRATREELMLIHGIGEAISGRIIQHRESLGGFTTVAQLVEVQGISYNTLERIGGYFFVGRWEEEYY